MITVNTDGGARGNPGPAGIGYVIAKDGAMIKEGNAYIGETTNNQAEYEALIRALTELSAMGTNGEPVEVRMDSELVIKQLRREYKVKDAGMKAQFAKAQELIKTFPTIVFTHVRREQNKRADELVNEALDARESRNV